MSNSQVGAVMDTASKQVAQIVASEKCSITALEQARVVYEIAAKELAKVTRQTADTLVEHGYRARPFRPDSRDKGFTLFLGLGNNLQSWHLPWSSLDYSVEPASFAGVCRESHPAKCMLPDELNPSLNDHQVIWQILEHIARITTENEMLS